MTHPRLLRQRMFFIRRGSHMPQRGTLTRAEVGEVPAGLREAQPVIGRTPTHQVGVVVILTVVLPETPRTDLVVPAAIQRQITAARTRVRAAAVWDPHVRERAVIHPAHSASHSRPEVTR